MEAHMQSDAKINKDKYYNLTHVVEFEAILKDLQSAIYRTCESEMTFWTHLLQATAVDLNVLDKDNEKIYRYAHEADEYWKQLCAINPYYDKAIIYYSMYLREIRNSEQEANELIEKQKNDNHRKNLNNFSKFF